jgi:signal peptidase II
MTAAAPDDTRPADDGLTSAEAAEAATTAGTAAGGDDAGVPEATANAWRGPSAKRWILFAAISITVVVLDQLSKSWVAANVPVGTGISILGDWLNFVHARNSGALFGLLPQSAPAFALVSLGVVALIVVYQRKGGRGIVTTIALALLLGGALGNLIDRLRWGYVLDWIDMGIGSTRFWTYNIADSAISVAIICLIALAIFPKVGDWGAE